MIIERRLRTRLKVNLVLLAYWFPALVADIVIQCPTVDGLHIFTDYATNWGLILIFVHLIIAIAITAMNMKHNGVTERLTLLRNRVTHVAMLVTILVTLNFVILQMGLYKASKWTLQNIHEHLMNSIVMLISVISLNSHFRMRDIWLGKLQ